MVDSTRTWLSARNFAVSILMVAVGACVVAGLFVAIRFVITAAGDPATSGGEYVLGVILGFILYGPALLWAVWPIAVSAIVAAGVGLAFLRHRYDRGREDFAMSRLLKIGRVLLFGYAAVLAVTWLVWLLGGG